VIDAAALISPVGIATFKSFLSMSFSFFPKIGIKESAAAADEMKDVTVGEMCL